MFTCLHAGCVAALASPLAVPCTFVPRLPVDHAATAVFHISQINSCCQSSLIMPPQHLVRALSSNCGTVTSAQKGRNCTRRMNRAKLIPEQLQLWDKNTSHHENFCLKMLRNGECADEAAEICLCHSCTEPQCLKYAKRYVCPSLNKCVCVCVCVCVGSFPHYNTTVSSILTALCVNWICVK